MPQVVNSVLVVIASPGDTAEERAAVRNALVDWGVSTGRRLGVVALPWLWERQAVPEIGGRPQALINGQAVDRADVVVAFFDSRLGSHTGVDVSGTAEEIHRAMDLGKPVHVYFSDEPIARDADLDQLKALQDFRADLEKVGLLGTYSDPLDLAGQVVRAVEHDIDTRGWDAPAAPTSEKGAELAWRHDHIKEQKGLDRNGRMQCRSTTNRLVVQNQGSADATDLVFDTVWEADPAAPPPRIEERPAPVTVPAHSEMQWLCVPLAVGNLRINATWTEAGQPREQTWTVLIR
ncbi:MAG: hypothetical protein QM628_15655 [Propionicimonas sp.]